MRILIGILCFFVVIFPDYVESIWSFANRAREKAAIHPAPIQLAANHYTSCRNRETYNIHRGFWKVGVDNSEDYVIGFLEDLLYGYILCPFVAPRADLGNQYGKVKLRLHDGNTTEIVPILKNDPVERLFCQKFNAGYVRIGYTG